MAHSKIVGTRALPTLLAALFTLLMLRGAGGSGGDHGSAHGQRRRIRPPGAGVRPGGKPGTDLHDCRQPPAGHPGGYRQRAARRHGRAIPRGRPSGGFRARRCYRGRSGLCVRSRRRQSLHPDRPAPLHRRRLPPCAPVGRRHPPCRSRNWRGCRPGCRRIDTWRPGGHRRTGTPSIL